MAYFSLTATLLVRFTMCVLHFYYNWKEKDMGASLALELRFITGSINQPFDSFKRLEYKIPVFPNYSGAKYEKFEQNVVN